MLGSISVDYAVALAIDRESRPKFRRMLLCLSLGYNLSVLGFFKYFNFSSENLQVVAHQIGWELHPITLSVVLPVGISFYTFQSPSYTLDVYAKRLRPTQNYLDYTTFVCFFPQLVAGPIERAGHLLAQFQSHRVFDYQLATDGCRQVLWGAFKKMVLADNLAKVVDPAFGAGLEGASGVSLAVATVFFAFQIYFDFSAYSDIAVGLAKWFGIDLRRNFACPYCVCAIGWKSLRTWSVGIQSTAHLYRQWTLAWRVMELRDLGLPERPHCFGLDNGNSETTASKSIRLEAPEQNLAHLWHHLSDVDFLPRGHSTGRRSYSQNDPGRRFPP